MLPIKDVISIRNPITFNEAQLAKDVLRRGAGGFGNLNPEASTCAIFYACGNQLLRHALADHAA